MLDRMQFLDDEDLSSEVLVLYECERNRATLISVLVGAVQASKSPGSARSSHVRVPHFA